MTPSRLNVLDLRSRLKPINIAQISGKLVTSGVSDVAIATLYSEKTRMKKMITIINKIVS